jgi:hypothetical protein
MRSIHNSSSVRRSIASRWVAQCGKVGVSGMKVTQGWVWTWVVLFGPLGFPYGLIEHYSEYNYDHTASGICHTGSVAKQPQNLYDICLMLYVES